MVDFSRIASNLEQSENGIWVASSQRGVSYPEDGNETRFAIEDASYWFNHRNNVITHLVSRFSPSTVFFDIGGGNGCVSNALQSAGNEVVLVEPGSVGALNAKKRGVRTVAQSTLEDAGFEHGSLSSVGLFDVVEHIEDDAEFLQRVYYRILQLSFFVPCSTHFSAAFCSELDGISQNCFASHDK